MLISKYCSEPIVIIIKYILKTIKKEIKKKL